MRRRRFLTALVIIASTLTLNVYVDYLLILRNPAELEVMVNEALKAIAPDYAPKLGSVVEFSLSERRVVFSELEFHEKGHPESPLLKVARVEATLSLVPPALSQITLVEPEAVIRVDKEGNLIPSVEGADDATRPNLYADLNIRIRRGRLRIINDFQGLGSEALISDLNASLNIQTDLSLTGSGMARLGALFPEHDPRASGGTKPDGTPPGQRFKDVFPVVSFEVDGQNDGPLKAEIRLLRGSYGEDLKSIIPLEFQRAIWKELNPEGGVMEARLRVLAHDRGTQLAASIRPRGVTIQPRGFPIPITNIGGAFEVSLALEKGRAIPEILSVTWEHTEGEVAGGRVTSRGGVWPSDPGELTTLYVFVDAKGVGLTPALVEAMPDGIREVYKTFDPQGVIHEAKVSIVGGPHEADPDLFVEVSEMGGAISAMHVDYPMRLENVQGSFSLKPGPSVRVIATGQLEHGGEATVDAQVLAGDLIHVEVRGDDVPMGQHILDALPPAVHRRVAPFHPSGGSADFKVVVKKSAEGDITRPHVEIDLHGVQVSHEDFPYPLTANGLIVVDPIFPEGTLSEDDQGPELIALRFDLHANGPGLESATVKGPLGVHLVGGLVEGDLDIEVKGLDLDPLLLDALPPQLRAVREALQPRGRLATGQVRFRSAERFELQGRGDELEILLEAFPYPLQAKTFHVSRLRDEVLLHRVRGDCPGGGAFAAKGVLVLPRAPGELLLIDIEAQARNVEADQRLVEAVLQEDVREFLLALRPSGRLNADVKAQITPGIGHQPEILLDLKGVELYVDQLAPELEGFRDTPLRNVHGRIRVEVPDLVEFQGLSGRLAGAEVELAGSIGAASPLPPESLSASLGGLCGANMSWARERLGVPVDLNLHVGGFDLNDESERLLGEQARGILERFPSRGRVDVEGLVQRGRLDSAFNLLLRFVPRQLRVVPTFLQVPLEEVTGTLEIDDGEAVSIDLKGRVGAGRFRLRRSKSQEAGFPGAERAGMVVRVDLDDLRRPDDEAEREAFQELLPRRVQRSLDDSDPQGPLDVQMVLFLPPDMEEGDAPIEWLAEIRPGGFSASAGVRLEDVGGVVRASGRFSELRRGEARGEVHLSRLDWSKQTAHDVHGPFVLADGVLSVGTRDEPLVGELYGGRLAALIEYRFAEGAYRGWLEIREGLIARCLDELGELRSEPPQPSTSSPRPLTGKIFGTMDFHGGGRRLDGRPRPFEAEGALHVRETNLVEVKAFDWLRTVRDALRGETTKPEAFETMHVDYGMTLDRVTLRAVRLDSPSLVLVGGEDLIQGGEGWIRLSEDPATNGDIFLDLTPFDTGSTVLDNLLQMSVPLTGVTVRNKVYDPQVIVGVPFYGAAERIWRGFLGEDEDEADPEDAGEQEED